MIAGLAKRNRIPESVLNRVALSRVFDGVLDRYIELFSKKHHLVFEGWSGIVNGGNAIFNHNQYYINFFAIKADIDLALPKEYIETWINSGDIKKMAFEDWLLLHS